MYDTRVPSQDDTPEWQATWLIESSCACKVLS